MQESDAKFVQRCRNGDARAWDQLVRNYSGRLLNMAYRYTGNYSVAEELTQDIFVRVYENLSRFRSDSGSLKNWILRVGRNLIIDYYRAHKKEKHVAGSEELEVLDFGGMSPGDSPFQSLYVQEKSRFVHSGLDRLSAELKEAVVLRDIQGLTYQEIADVLEIPEGTVKSRINRGRIELAKALRRMQEEASS